MTEELQADKTAHSNANSRSQRLDEARQALRMTEDAFAHLMGFKTSSQLHHKSRRDHYWTDEQYAAARGKVIGEIDRLAADLESMKTTMQSDI